MGIAIPVGIIQASSLGSAAKSYVAVYRICIGARSTLARIECPSVYDCSGETKADESGADGGDGKHRWGIGKMDWAHFFFVNQQRFAPFI